MKKIGLLVSCLVLVFITSGCGNKKLDCTMKDDEMSARIKMNFDSKDKLKDGTTIYEFTADEDMTDDQLKDAKKYFEDSYKDSKLDTKVEIKDRKLVVTIKFTKDNFSELGFDSEDMSYDSILKEINEEENVTCKK